MSKNEIDYLTEDPSLPGQKYAIVSIVGPNSNQKCDVWGLKIRGVSDTLDKAKAMIKRIYKFDNNYDMYIVDVGKFFPLNVNPLDVQDVEYENEQLNLLVKNYLENREAATQHWHERKNEMMKEAIREGKLAGQKELSEKKEHPIAVLQRKRDNEEKIKDLQERLDSANSDLKSTMDKLETYTDEEKQLADEELKNAIKNNIEVTIPEENEKSITDIRNEIMNELNVEKYDTYDKENLEKTISELQKLDIDIKRAGKQTENDDSANELNELYNKQKLLKEKLNKFDSVLVNEYMNNISPTSNYDSLFS
jgi:hypothetical protein